jgi:hypothetical protein
VTALKLVMDVAALELEMDMAASVSIQVVC